MCCHRHTLEKDKRLARPETVRVRKRDVRSRRRSSRSSLLERSSSYDESQRFISGEGTGERWASQTRTSWEKEECQQKEEHSTGTRRCSQEQIVVQAILRMDRAFEHLRGQSDALSVESSQAWSSALLR